MDIARERSYPTPLANSPLLPMLILSLMRQKNAPNTAKFFQPEYDYIVVGSGSAGAVVASRLSEIPCVSVLLLEAGPSPPYITEVPGIAASFWNSDLSWTYMTVPQKFTGRLMENRAARWLGGKVIGGSSGINFMFYARGNRHNYDNWADAGAEGWSYKDVFPYFLKMEDNRDPDYVANGYHGVGGPLTVMRPWYHSEIKDPIFKAAKNLGYEILDSNAGRQTGFFDIQATLRDGQRCSTAKAYLVPAENRTNLDILANAFVRKVIIRNSRAIGVEFDFQGKTHVVKARKEVIVSAGSINTPQLLMLSGIGPKSELQKHKIPVVADLPVGKNLQNHAAMGIYFELSPTIEPAESKLTNPRNILEYIKNRSGPLGSDEMMSAFAWAKIDQVRPNVDLPDYDLLFAEGILFEEGLYPEVVEQVYGPYEGKPIFGCVANMIQPRSRGTVTLNSTDPYDPPIVDPRYYEDPRDVDAVVDGLKVCNRIGSSPEFRAIGSVPTRTVFPGCESFVDDEEAMYRCMIKSFVIVYPHQSGTARMGNPNDPRTVVDPQLRVKGVQGLRVADASVMPFVPSDGPNVPAIMVGEKLSDMIKATIQCTSYRRDKEWWHGPDNSRWTEQKHYQSPSDLESHIPSNIY